MIKSSSRKLFAALAIATPLIVGACAEVPREAVELSATVGRDLEEVHSAHVALAKLHFEQSKNQVNDFIDDVYRPAFIAKFAVEAQLDRAVRETIETEPEKLLEGLSNFVMIAHERIEAKRRTLLRPVEEQEAAVIEEIDAAHSQLQAAQAIVTGHLASVRKVHDVQNELLANVGLTDLRAKIATKTADVSTKVGELVSRGEEINVTIEDAIEKINDIDARIDEFTGEFK